MGWGSDIRKNLIPDLYPRVKKRTGSRIPDPQQWFTERFFAGDTELPGAKAHPLPDLRLDGDHRALLQGAVGCQQFSRMEGINTVTEQLI